MTTNSLQAIRPVEILMVEDNPGDVELTQIALKRGKIANNLTVAEDGVMALAMLRGESPHEDAPRPDLILMDLKLPKKSGHDVLAEIKQDSELCMIPVAVLTSSKADEDIVKSYSHHANCYISKPVDLHQFIEVVQHLEEFWFTVVRLPSPVSRS